jgi:hypothetical protein
MDIDDCTDSSSISSSLSSNSSDFSIRKSNKKPRLEETNKDASTSVISDHFVGVGVLISEMNPADPIFIVSDDSSVSHCHSKTHPRTPCREISEDRDVNGLYSSTDPLDKSTSTGSLVHVISPLPSHLDLLLLNSSVPKQASIVRSKQPLACKEYCNLNSAPLEVNKFRGRIVGSAENSAVLCARSRGRVIISLLLLVLTVFAIKGFLVSPDVVANSIYVTGGGFSGFWFTLGRLQGVLLDHSEPKELYCYSSGCLALVAALSRYTMEEMWNIAYNVQTQWKQGQISRYDVVATFVDDLLYGPDRSFTSSTKNLTVSLESPSLRLRPLDLSSLKVITTVNDGWFGAKTSIRSAETVSELRAMLIQTTWIPFAIGNGLWYSGHMDGAFTTPFHPVTELAVGLELDWDLYANVLNVNLGRDKVEKFWKKGTVMGL